jgi:hypothetical protein
VAWKGGLMDSQLNRLLGGGGACRRRGLAEGSEVVGAWPSGGGSAVGGVAGGRRLRRWERGLWVMLGIGGVAWKGRLMDLWSNRLLGDGAVSEGWGLGKEVRSWRTSPFGGSYVIVP